MYQAKMSSCAAFVSAMFLALACSGGPAPSAGRNRPSGPRAVVTAHPEAAPWPRSIEIGGTLAASERVEIAARIEGAVIDLEVDLGDRVTRGQTLARITAEDFAARVAQSDAELSQARADVDRLRALAERDLASRERLEQAETRARVLNAQRRLAGRQLRDTRVIAPFDGAIAQRLVSPGAFVRIGAPLFVLVATSPLELALDVPERLASEVRAGTTVRVSHASGEAITGQIARVSPVVDPAARTFRAIALVPLEGADVSLWPGMYVTARVELGVLDDAVRLPRGAVFEVLGRSRVVEVVDGRAQPHDVELIAEDDGAAIVRGITETSEVVVRSPGLLAPGTEVRAEPPAGEPAAQAPASEAGDGT